MNRNMTLNLFPDLHVMKEAYAALVEKLFKTQRATAKIMIITSTTTPTGTVSVYVVSFQ